MTSTNEPQPNILVHTLRDDEDIKSVLTYIKAWEGCEISIDVETNHKSPHIAELWGFGFNLDGEESFYVPLRFKDRSYNQLITKDLLLVLLTQLSTKYKILGHNFIYDYIVLKKYCDLDFKSNLHCDTILLKHTVDEERPHGLKETCVKYLGEWSDKAQDKLYASIEANGGTTTKDNLEMWKADTDVLAEYCGWDCALTYLLYKKLSIKLKEENLETLFYDDEVMPLYKKVTFGMNEYGFPVDVQHFKDLQTNIRVEIKTLEDTVHELIAPMIEPLCSELLNEEFPVKRTGNFPKAMAEVMGVQLPVNAKTGAVTLSRSVLQKTLDPAHPYSQWLLDGASDSIVEDKTLDAQIKLFFDKYPDKNYIFNLKSNDHIGTLLFDILGEDVRSKTDSGKPAVDEDTLDGYKYKYDWINTFIDMKKLNKLEATYINSILEKQLDGVVYPSFQQFGTTSGRYSCVQPNLQNLPRVKDEESDISPLVLKYANEIKRGFIAPKGFKIIGADFSQLEPCAFAAASGDPDLQEVFRKGHDLYSAIAIKTFNLPEYSADKKAPNYLGLHRKEARQKAKVIALAVVYGAEAGRLRSILECTTEEAQDIINAYLDAYPNLRKYMQQCDEQLLKTGLVSSRFGRVRHVPKAKRLYEIYGNTIMNQREATKAGIKDLYWEMKNMRNLAKNHPIQSTAAYIVNKSSISMADKLALLCPKGYIAAQIHDELTCLIPEEFSLTSVDWLQRSMEDTVKIEVPLSAKPVIADNWADAK